MDSKFELCELRNKLDLVLTTLDEMKEQNAPRVYSTDELVEYLKVGKGAIEKLRQNGELPYTKLGRTYIYTQQDVDILLQNNHYTYI